MKTKELVRDAFLAALLLVLQVSLSWLPNIELVSLLMILYTLVFRRHVWVILYVFVILEGLIYGFGLWWFSYLYVWAFLCTAVFLMRWTGKPRTISAALLAGIFGMLFGLFCFLLFYRRSRSRPCLVDSRNSLRHHSRHQQLYRDTSVV